MISLIFGGQTTVETVPASLKAATGEIIPLNLIFKQGCSL
jgi:hypothetical protein